MSWLDQLVEYAEGRLGDREREALWMRGVTDEQVTLFHLGYLNSDLPDLEYPEGFLEWADNGKTLDDVFLLPLTTALGQVKGLQFRHVERSRAGYRNFMPYDSEPVYFGLGQAMPHIWRTGEVLLVEGGFDLFPVQRVYPQVVATLTARLTGQFARLLYRIAGTVWFCYDWDDAGRNGVEKFRQSRYRRYFKHHVIRRPGDAPSRGSKGRVKDPSELWEAWGDDRFGVFLKTAVGP